MWLHEDLGKQPYKTNGRLKIWVRILNPICVAWHEMKRRIFFVKNVKTL
jgi:hypothetical protein